MENSNSLHSTFTQNSKAETHSDQSMKIHRALNEHYLRFLAEPENFAQVPSLATSLKMKVYENEWINELDARAKKHSLPQKSSEFLDWYEAQSERHSKEIQGLIRYLADEANLDGMALFIGVEEQVDSKFDDMMALAQLGTSGKIKMTIGENYWDEMGHGDENFVHTTMFSTAVTWMRKHLDSQKISTDSFMCPEIYANSNQLLAYGLDRRYGPRLLGALGVLEQTASERFQSMVDGCRRLGVPEEIFAYQTLHVGVDCAHGEEWLKHALNPLAARSQELMHEICLGVLTRCDVAVQYYNSVHQSLISEDYS